MRRLFTWKWLGLTLLAVGLIYFFIRMGLWQLHRAESSSGSAMNVGYALEWPTFALLTVVGWVKFLRDDIRAHAGHVPEKSRVRVGVTAPRQTPEQDEAEDAELAAYNRYLASLAAREADREAAQG